MDSAKLQYEGDPNTPAVFTVAIVTAILMLAVVIFTVVLFQNAQAVEDEDKLVAAKPIELAEQRTLQLAQISQYRYISEREGVVGIPIDRAIELFVTRVQADPQQASPHKIEQAAASAPTAPGAPLDESSATQPTGGGSRP
jgi:hypothetical protein